ncbi:MAG TPA: exopolysaccharide biosynthesis protein [Rhizobiaceae bacterium]|nr:exopolysaccharide biosynthesis protein [Rhizobiaceae bacterium]
MGDRQSSFDVTAISSVAQRRPARLSRLFMGIARRSGDRVSVRCIHDALGDRGFAALLVVFAAFNLIPMPPGASTFLGLPMVVVAAQMMCGRRQAWLPAFILDRSISADQFRSAMGWGVPRLVRLERLIRPRYWPFWRRQGDCVVGFLGLVMAVVVTLPIPLGNWLPAFSTVLLGLSLVERDGLLFAAGSVVGVAALTVTAVVVGSAGAATYAALGWIF